MWYFKLVGRKEFKVTDNANNAAFVRSLPQWEEISAEEYERHRADMLALTPDTSTPPEAPRGGTAAAGERIREAITPAYHYLDLVAFYEIMVSLDAQNDTIEMLAKTMYEDQDDLKMWAELTVVCEALRDARKAAQQPASE